MTVPDAAPGSSQRPQHLVLLGGGHAHLAVLQDLAQSALPGWEVTLVTPYRRQIYSGMLPGWVAGHYRIDDCAIALDALAARAGVALHLAACTAIDLAGGRISCSDGQQLPFDRVSIDTGPVAALGDVQVRKGDGALLPIRPIEGFVAAWPALVERIRADSQQRFELVVLGAGAAGVELAFAVRRRARTDGLPNLKVTLVGSGDAPLSPAMAAGARRRVATLLRQQAIGWVGGQRARAVSAGRVWFADPAHPGLPCDACIAVTGAAAPAWPAASGLATDAGGFVRVGPTLQSVSHPQVTAAGDIATFNTDPRPKSGVFAVRAGEVLARNLRALCTGEGRAQAWKPQRRALYLLSTGNEHAIAAWGRWAWGGGWVWRWKDRIDRRFVARFGSDADADAGSEEKAETEMDRNAVGTPRADSGNGRAGVAVEAGLPAEQVEAAAAPSTIQPRIRRHLIDKECSMSDQAKLDTWIDYQAAWSAMAADERRALLAKSVDERCTYSDPTGSCDGVDALAARIEKSQEKMPGVRFRNDKFLNHHDHGLSEWTMFDGKGEAVTTGTSYARFGADGRLTQMTGFFEQKKS